MTGGALVFGGCQSFPAKTGAHPEFHAALLSDTHVPGDRKNGHRGFNPWENLRRIIPSVAAEMPEAVILSGDAARLEGKVEDYQELKSLLGPVAKESPVFVAMGNHDDRKAFSEVFSDPRPEKQKVPDKEVLVIDHPVVRVIILDSLMYVNKVAGLLGKEQRRWLEADLAQHADKPAVLFVHHTLGDGDGDLMDTEWLFDLLKPARHVKAIFFGHSHVWKISERQRIKLINLPAVGYNFRDEDPVGWMDAKFHRRGVDLVLYAIGGNQGGDGKTFRVPWS